MDLQTVNELLAKQNGNFSQMAPLFGERLDVYPDHELPFPGEFLFFEERYLAIKKHILENDIKQDLVDIGCQFGLQSEIFLDALSYVGIDCQRPSYFMNSDKPNVRYEVGLFPNEIDVELTGKTVISSMSLGYFDAWVNEDQQEAQNQIVEKLKNCSVLYIATKKELVNALSPYFERVECLQEVKGDFDLYVLQK